MKEINAKIVIQDDINSILNVTPLAIEEQIENWVETNINIEDAISDWMRNEFDIDTHLRDADFASYVTEVVDVEYDVRNLLENYSPVTNCSTGSAFTEAVSKAIRAFLHSPYNVEYIIKAIDRYNKYKSAEELAESLKEKHYDQFKKELEQYAKAVESNKIDQYNPFIQNHAE